jgi:hypothetical protein
MIHEHHRRLPKTNFAVNNPLVLLVEDTDLLILLLFHFDLDSNDIYFKSMSTSSTTMKIWDVRKTKSTLGLDTWHILPFVHAISGCDMTSRMFGIELFIPKSLLLTLTFTLRSTTEEDSKTKLFDKCDYFTFPIVNFPFTSSNIPASPKYGVYISQPIFLLVSLMFS